MLSSKIKLAVVIGTACILTGCSGTPQAPVTITVTAPAPSAGASPTATASPSQETYPSTPPPSTNTSSASDQSTDSSSESTDSVLKPEKKGQHLTLADFFQPSGNWSESRYDLADKQGISGISAIASSCYGSNAQTLELRLANNFNNLTFSVAQANDSISSNQSLSVRVMGNNKQLDVQSVPFNKIQKFSVPVVGVNAATILIQLDSDTPSCGGSVKAVIYDIELS